MRLLLDTHIWLWSLREPTRLGRRLRHELKGQNNELGGARLGAPGCFWESQPHLLSDGIIVRPEATSHALVDDGDTGRALSVVLR